MALLQRRKRHFEFKLFLLATMRERNRLLPWRNIGIRRSLKAQHTGLSAVQIRVDRYVDVNRCSDAGEDDLIPWLDGNGERRDDGELLVSSSSCSIDRNCYRRGNLRKIRGCRMCGPFRGSDVRHVITSVHHRRKCSREGKGD